MTAAAPTFELLRRASVLMPPARIADAIGLHANTVQRWLERGTVPGHYRLDFLRLLGMTPTRDEIQAADKDQFYTKPAVARDCWNTFRRVAADLEADLSRRWFVEPAAGCGWFYDRFPAARRIGLDIDPKPAGAAARELQQADFLSWTPPSGRRYAVVGNPPFGLRGHLALQFVNRAADFADLVGFILPQLFESDGKGAPMKRVDKRLALAHSEWLSPDSFVYPNGKPVSVNAVFQVWTKINRDKIARRPAPTCDRFIRVYSLSDGGTPSSTRNKAMIGACDVYLPSTCYDGMRAYSAFEELPNARGYGVVIRRRKREIGALLRNHDWTRTAFASTNSALNLRSGLIRQVVVAAGHCDE